MSSLTEPAEALNLDLRQQKLFISYYNNLPEKPSTTLRFFNHTDFYTLQGHDATLASEYTGNIIKQMGEDPKLSYVVLRKTQFEKFVRELLIVRQYRVEVFVKNTSGKINDWSLEYKGSPGNLSQFEDILFDNAAITFSNYVMAIKIVKSKVIAIACVNSTELKFQVCQLNDNDCFTELEALIAQIGPRECLIPAGDSSDLISLRKVLDRNNILVAKVKPSDFNTKDVIQDLNRLLYFHEEQQRNASSFSETEQLEALSCLNAAIKFLNLTADSKNFNQFKISTIDVNRFLRLNNAALYSLNILPKTSANIGENSALLPNSNKSFTLRGVLDSCATSQGRRLLDQWIKQPLKDLNLINERLEIVECFFKDAEIRENLRTNNLPRLPDLLGLSRKLSSKKCNLQDCYTVYQVVTAVPSLIKVLEETRNSFVKSALISPLSETNADLQKYVEMIEEVLDLDLVDRGEFFVKKSYSEALDELYSKKEKIEEKMQKLLRNAANDLGFEEGKTIKLECNDQHGYFFRVTLKEEHALRSNKEYKIIGAIKGGVRFTNEKLLKANDDYREINQEYEEEQKSVISEIFEVAAGYGDSLRSLNLNIATVDVLVSFASASVNARIPYVRPKMHPEGAGVLKLVKARHPCLESQDHISFIPNNVEFGSNKTFHIITGPNMCGKSTYIRSVGICVLMAQIGCFVPCEFAEISIVDGILSRVGADDCQLKGLSTFMLEMIETSTIIRSATSNSLVIIDELGRGTSTYDGCGIAFAIAEYLAKETKCFSLFATHFHEVTRLAEICPSVNNLHVTAVTTNNTITPLYQVRSGVCDNSYGVHCAKMADFPDDVIEVARNYLKELEYSAGTQLIKDYEQGLKRQIIKDGDKIIQETLEKLKSLPVDNLTDDQLAEEIYKIKNSLMGAENLFVKGLLS